MGGQGNNPIKKMYRLVVLLVVLQAAAIGLVLRFATDSIERDKTLLDRTGVMIDQIFPELRQNIGEVSRKATQIRGDISGLQDQVSKVDEHVAQVERGVADVGSGVEKMDKTLSGFVNDTSGLIWGHSVNPYVLIALSLALMAAIPASGWIFSRKRGTEPSLKAMPYLSPEESFSSRLDKLHTLVQKIRNEGINRRPSPELQKLMIETEHLIREARRDLELIAPAVSYQPTDEEINRDELH